MVNFTIDKNCVLPTGKVGFYYILTSEIKKRLNIVSVTLVDIIMIT